MKGALYIADATQKSRPYLFRLGVHTGEGQNFIELLQVDEKLLVIDDEKRYGHKSLFVRAIHPKYGLCEVRCHELKKWCVMICEGIDE